MVAHPAQAASLLATLERPPSTFMQDVWQRLTHNRAGIIGLSAVGFFVLLAVVGPLLVPNDPLAQTLTERLRPPTLDHPFGLDELGRDVLSRVVNGARTSLTVGLLAVSLALICGTLLGLVAGYLGGPVDGVIMRFMDIILAFPATLLAIGIVSARGPGLFNTMIAIGFVSIPIYARVTRSTVLSLKEREFVTAARATGVSVLPILFRHILPNSLSPILVQGTLGIALAIVEAAGLGFLGLGAQPPAPEWGAMLASGYVYLLNGPWAMIFPGAAIVLAVLGFNMLGDGLRDALDPFMR